MFCLCTKQIEGHLLNDLTSDIDLSERSSINTLVNDFTNIIRNVADPLFERNIKTNHSSSFSDKSISESAEWFDNECMHYRTVYLESLKIFNRFKTTDNREIFCKRKKEYKDLCRKKKRMCETKKLKQI